MSTLTMQVLNDEQGKYIIPTENREGQRLSEEDLVTQAILIKYITGQGKARYSGSRFASFVAHGEIESLVARGEEVPRMLAANIPPYHMDNVAMDFTLEVGVVHPSRWEALGFTQDAATEHKEKDPWTVAVWHHKVFLISLYEQGHSQYSPYKDNMLSSMARSGQWGALQFNKDARDLLWAAQINYTNSLMRGGYL